MNNDDAVTVLIAELVTMDAPERARALEQIEFLIDELAIEPLVSVLEALYTALETA